MCDQCKANAKRLRDGLTYEQERLLDLLIADECKGERDDGFRMGEDSGSREERAEVAEIVGRVRVAYEVLRPSLESGIAFSEFDRAFDDLLGELDLPRFRA